MRNVDGKKFAFAAVFRALALGAVVGGAVGITALIAPAAIPAVALWTGVGAGVVWGGSLLVSIDAANREANIDWECPELYEHIKPSLWGKLEMAAYNALESVFTREWKDSKAEKETTKQEKISTKMKLDGGIKKEEEVKQEEHQVDAPEQQQNGPDAPTDDGPSSEI